METRYTKVGGAEVAFRILSEGPIDMLLFLSEYLPVDALEEEPRYARAIRRLGSLGRLTVFNRRGVGLSDAPGGPLTTEQQVEDAVAVLDEIEATRTVVIAANVGVAAAITFAATHPDRVSALILINASARLLVAPDYEIGFPEEFLRATSEQTTATGATETGFDFLTAFAPSVAKDERFRAWWDQAGHRGASPSRSRELWELIITADVRHLLPDITAPSLVVRMSGLGVNDQSKYLADHITDARYVETPGADLVWWAGNADAVLDEIEKFLAVTVGSAAKAQRALATVMFTDVVSSTERAAAIGDRRWRDVLDSYHDIARHEIERYGGRFIGSSGDGFLATFDMPAEAVRCARAIAIAVRSLDIDVRAGVHTGEIEILGADVAGIGVHIAARVMSAAAPGEVLVSRTVADLVTGSGLSFEDRGEHDLKGVPGRWGLYAVQA